MALLLSGVIGAGGFHNRLVASSPAADETVSATPEQVRLWFAEPPVPRLSGIALWTIGPDSTRLKLEKVAATDTSVSVAAKVPGPLSPGEYRIRWRTASEDGHVIRGWFDFRISP